MFVIEAELHLERAMEGRGEGGGDPNTLQVCLKILSPLTPPPQQSHPGGSNVCP